MAHDRLLTAEEEASFWQDRLPDDQHRARIVAISGLIGLLAFGVVELCRPLSPAGQLAVGGRTVGGAALCLLLLAASRSRSSSTLRWSGLLGIGGVGLLLSAEDYVLWSSDDPVMCLGLLLLTTALYLAPAARPLPALAAGILLALAHGVVLLLTGQDGYETLLYLLVLNGFLLTMGRHQERLERRSFLQQQALNELAWRDPLTGLLNRRAFREHLERVWALARREGQLVALLIADIDHFKRYNDHYGHLGGDEALQRVAAQLEVSARGPMDAVCRFGGEEFVIAWPGVTRAEALRHAADLLARMRLARLPHAASPTAAWLTLSAGLALIRPTREEEGIEQALSRADGALYAAKAAGRDRAMCSPAPGEPLTVVSSPLGYPGP